MAKYSQYITLGYDGEGRRVRKHVYGNTRKELAEAIVQAQKEFDSTPTQDCTWGEYSARWKSVYKDMLNPHTVEMYHYALKHTEVLNSIYLRDITETDCQEIIKANWKHPVECGKIAMTLNEIFKKAIKDKIIKENPAEDITLPTVVQKPKRALTEKEKKVIRNLIDIHDDRLDDRDKMFLACEYYFGLRPEETRALMFSDFKDKGSNLTIERAVSHDKNNCLLKTTKTDNVRILPVPDAFKPLFDWYRMKHRKMYLFTLLESDDLLTKSAQTKMWGRIKKQINLACGGTEELNVLGDNFTFYVFRRTYATNLYYAGITIKMAAYLMGHKSLQMILEVYAQLDAERENVVALRSII